MRDGPVKPDAQNGAPASFLDYRLGAAHRPTPAQYFCWLTFTLAFVAPAFVIGTRWVESILHTIAYIFIAAAFWRLLLMALAHRPLAAPSLATDRLPTYTILAPAYREAAMLPQLVESLAAIDYPADRRQVILALEAHDTPTLAAAQALDLPAGFQVLIVPPGEPKTKPRACNAALACATGDLLVIYDAEDRPEPGQLREAAATFEAAPQSLACLQAPLRIANSAGFLPAQFANEYGAQFELQQPALARLGLPFPLGGTSNHFRTSVLRRLGGWDPYNVTEDADLGFRLARAGYRTGVISSPTWETAPENFGDWLLQRSRWLKGYMQTFGVQTRDGLPPPRIAFALLVTLGLALVSAGIHAWTLLWLLLMAGLGLAGVVESEIPPIYLTALGFGTISAIASKLVGAGRAGTPVRWRDGPAALLYWPLLSAAFLHAAGQLFLRPHHWHKTPHHPWRLDTP